VPKPCKGSPKDSPALKKLKPTLPSFVLSVLLTPKRGKKGPPDGIMTGYGPYGSGAQNGPQGRMDGGCRVFRGGFHSSLIRFLRSANRGSWMPNSASDRMGFRVVQGELPKGKLLPAGPPPLNAQNVSQTVPRIEPHPAHGPFLEGPKPFVRIAHDAACPVFRRANHSPGLPECPNGDLLAVWFFSLSEVDLTTSNAASRLRFGAPEWEPAAAFRDAQDANALPGCRKMDLSPETRSSQQTELGIGRNHRASRLNGVSGDQTVERIAVHVWKFARAIDEQFVQRQVFDLEIGAAGWDPLFRRLGKRELSRAMFHHHFEHACVAHVQDRRGVIQNFPCRLGYHLRFARQPEKSARIEQDIHIAPQARNSSSFIGRNASSGIWQGSSIISPTFGRGARSASS
jgi:hypothetical protein